MANKVKPPVNFMAKKQYAFTFLNAAFNILRSERQIWFPLAWIFLINVFFLELTYFIPRLPLSSFFAPMIKRLWGADFLHYPLDLALLPKIYYYVQAVLDVFIGSFILSAVSVMVTANNNDSKISFKDALNKIKNSYIHILFYSILLLIVFQAFTSVYDVLSKRAYQIQSSDRILYLIKKMIIIGGPFVQFFWGVLLTVLFAYVVPVIVNEQKKFFPALNKNFKLVFRSFWLTFLIVLVPSILFLPILILRLNVGFFVSITIPEIQILFMILSLAAITIVNAIILTVATLVYLYNKET